MSKKTPKRHEDILDHEAYHREDSEQITVWEADTDGTVHVWFESEDGECSFSLHPDECKRLAARLLGEHDDG